MTTQTRSDLEPGIFDRAESIQAVIYQAIGAGSTCWESMEGTGVFQEQWAREIGQQAMNRINQLLWKMNSHK